MKNIIHIKRCLYCGSLAKHGHISSICIKCIKELEIELLGDTEELFDNESKSEYVDGMIKYLSYYLALKE